MPAVGYPSSGSCNSGFGWVLSHSEYRFCLQYQQAPHEMNDGTTTRSPRFTFVTPGPVSTTSPMNSWPITSPGFMVGRYPSMKCRSDPQVVVSRTFRIMSRGLTIAPPGG